MKKIIFTILIALSLSNVAFAAGEASVPNGGTGWGSFISGSVLFGGSRFQLATSSSLTFSTSTNVLTTPNASTTQITTTNLFLTGASNGCLQISSLLVTSTGSACGTGSGGTSNWTRFNNSGIYPATSTDQVVIGNTSTSTLSKLEVTGGAFIDRANTTNATSTNFFATTASTTQEYSGLGISIATTTAPDKSINIQKDDATPFLRAGRGAASGWLQQSFSSAIYTTLANGGFMVYGDNIQDGVGKIVQFAFPHQNQGTGGQSCFLRGTSGSGFNSIIVGGGSSACKANEYFYVFNSGGTGSTTATGVQALQIDPLGQAIFGPGSTNTGYKLTVVGDTLLFGTTTASRFTATSTTLTSTFPIITNTDITSTRATTTNATSTNFFTTLASTTNLYIGNGISIGTTTAPFRSISIQKEDGTTAYEMSRGVVNYSESMFANNPTFVSNSGTFVYGSNLTDSVDKLTRLRFWGYTTASGIANCGISNDSRAATNLILFGGVSSNCYGPTEYRFYISSSTNSTYQEGALTLNNTGLSIGNVSPTEKLFVLGSTTVASRVTASAFTATSSSATSSIPRIENTVLYMNGDYITDMTGSGLEIVGQALTVNASALWSTTSADFYVNASTTIPKTYSANTWTASNVFNGGLTIDALNGPLQANNGVVSATTSIGVVYGGLGLTSAPAYGQIPVGNSSGGYTLTATSSLAIGSASSTLLADNNTFSGLDTFAQTITTSATTTDATSTNLFATTASTTNLYASQALIGTSTALSVDQLVSTGDVDTYSLTLSNSAASGFNPWRISATGAGWSAGDGKLVIVPPGNTLSASSLLTLDGSTGRVGISTTSPYAKLSVVGQTVSEYFTATSTTATSTLPKIDATVFKLDGDTFTDLTGTGLANVNGVLTVTGTASSTLLSDNNLFTGENSMTRLTVTNGTTTNATTTNLKSSYGLFGDAYPLTTDSTVKLEVWGDNNGAVQMGIGNKNAGTSAYNCLFQNNDRAVPAVTDYAATCLNSGAYSDVAFGTGMAVPSQWSFENTMGQIGYFMSSSTIASTSPAFDWYTYGRNLDHKKMTLTANGSLGVGTSTPFAKLSVDTSSTTSAIPSFVIGSSTKTDFIVNGLNGNIGIGTTTLNRAKLSIAGNEAVPSVIVAGGLSGVDLFRFYRPTALGGTGQGLALLVSGGNAQFSFRTGLDATSAGTTRNTFMYDVAGNGLSISTSTSAGVVTGLEAFYLKNSTGNIGLSGTTTPWGSVSINPTIYTPAGQPTFVVGSSTKTDFLINQGGLVAVGTSTVGNDVRMTVSDPTATSTVFIRSNSTTLGGRLIMEDVTGTTCTEITTNAGAIISKAVTCP